MKASAKAAAFWAEHEPALKPIGLGVLAGAILAILAVPIDTKLSEDNTKLVGDIIAVAAPALAAALLILALLSPSMRLGFSMAALTIATVYPFLLPATPWWALGPVIAIHLMAFSLNCAPWTRLAMATLGAPILIQAAYKEDLGPYNPLLAGLALMLHLVALWLMLPPSAWRAVPQKILTGAFLLVAALAAYSLTQAVEWDRAVALILSVAAGLGCALVPKSSIAQAQIHGVRLQFLEPKPMPIA